MFKIIIGVVVVGIIALGAFMAIDPNFNKSKAPTQDVTEVEKNTFQATIEGEVFKSGTYTMREGSTLGDLITSAGGTTDNVDYLAYIETYEISAGGSYYIAPKYNYSDVCNTTEIVKVNINTATTEELMAVNGFTSSISSNIVSYRTSSGDFQCIEQLLDVYGIGNATYRKVRNFVILHD